MGLYVEVFQGMTYDELLPLAKEVGFDGFFSNWEYATDLEKMRYYKNMGEKLGLDYETSHSVIPGSNTVWTYGKDGDDFIDLMKQNTDNCHALGIDTLVVHVQPRPAEKPSLELGISRFDKLVKYAKARGIKIAFENIGMPEFLFGTLDAFQDSNVGYCYDSGHEACIVSTRGMHLLDRLGDRLICTHLHDNDNKTDLHLIPYDGEIGFDRVVNDIRACSYKGNITLELNYESYAEKMTKRDYLKKAYDVAVRIRDAINK